MDAVDLGVNLFVALFALVDPIGNIPIFVSADSADVWANPCLFKLDEERRPRFRAGVAVYPDCGLTSPRFYAPILTVIGELDDTHLEHTTYEEILACEPDSDELSNFFSNLKNMLGND